MRELAALTFLLALGCAVATPPTLLPEAERIQVGQDNPPAGMEEVGTIEAVDGHGCGGFGKRGTYEGAIVALKNEALRLGASYVQIMMLTEPHLEGSCFKNGFIIRGVAYRASSAE